MEATLSAAEVISLLTRSVHKDLDKYIPVATAAAKVDPGLLAHVIAWNALKGEVRDAKLALPIVHLSQKPAPAFAENAAAHLALLDPRMLVAAARFAHKLGLKGKQRGLIYEVVERYLRAREAHQRWWDQTVLQHRRSINELYTAFQVKPSPYAQLVLFGRAAKGMPRIGPPAGTVHEVVEKLHTMEPKEAAQAILKHRIPWLVATGARNLKHPDMLLALVENMTGTEALNNAKTLKAWGAFDLPAVKAAYDLKLQEAASEKKGSGRVQAAIEAVDDERLKARLKMVEERKMERFTIDGNWVVACDKSSSMTHAIDPARMVAAALAKAVKGKVWLAWIDTMARVDDVTGMTYEQIREKTRHVAAGGGTALGAVANVARERAADGVVLVSDGGDRGSPGLEQVWSAYWKLGERPALYFLRLKGQDPDWISSRMDKFGCEMTTMDIDGVDLYSLPNLVQTLRVGRYSLFQEVMDTPLLTLDEVFKAAA